MPSTEKRRELIAQLRAFPQELEAIVQGLSDEDLTTHFIDGEWTVAQNVHHVADSHMNAYIRFKLILMENSPRLKGYNQDEWATTADSQQADMTETFVLLRGLHGRWANLMESLLNDETIWARSAIYPDAGPVTLDGLLETYVAHGLGHIDQIQRTLDAKGNLT